MWRLASTVAPWPRTALWSVDRHGPLRLNLTSPYAERQLYRGQYERDELTFTRGFVQKGDLCVDVGANLGMYTLMLSALVGDEGRVLAFEPSPIAFPRLAELANRLGNVNARRAALGSHQGTGTLTVALGDSMHSSLRTINRPKGRRVIVDVVTLDQVLCSAPSIGLVKIDVEGYEQSVLAGMRQLLERQRIRALLVEVEPEYGDTQWVTNLLDLPGYQLRRVSCIKGIVRNRPNLVDDVPARLRDRSPFSLAVVLRSQIGPGQG